MANQDVETVNVTEARQNFSSLLNRVFKEQERVVIEKSGIPMAVLVPIDDLRPLKLHDEVVAERSEFLDGFRELFKDADQDELQREIDRGVAEARAEMRAEREAKRLAS